MTMVFFASGNTEPYQDLSSGSPPDTNSETEALLVRFEVSLVSVSLVAHITSIHKASVFGASVNL